MKKKKIFWLAGEPSADVHSSLIIREVNQRSESIMQYGVGGKRMVEAGLKAIFPFQRFCVMGFWEVVKHLRFFLRVETQIESILRNDSPDLIVLVDYPGLNMRIAEKASRLGIPVIYFISPQFWAWKFKRIEKMKKYVTHLCYILPFEKQYFQDYHIPATYVGHPIAEEIEINLTKQAFAEKYQLNPQKKWIGFFPGSRENEIKKLMPVFVETIKLLRNSEYEFLISQANLVKKGLFDQLNLPETTKLVQEDNYEMMKHCDFLVVKSGTTTLEAGFIGTPFIIVYISSIISYEIGKRLVKIKRIGLVNIVLNEDIIPELVQHQVSPANIKKQIDFYLSHPNEYKEVQKKLRYLHGILGAKKTSKEVADIIWQKLDE